MNAESSSDLPHVIIHTDGGCSPNPGPGGWSAILSFGDHERELKGGEANSTNNRMELMAAISALEALKRPCSVDLHTDSQYLRNGIMSWIKTWKKNGWRTSDKKPVKNVDLWQRLDAALGQNQIRWHWVRGHSGHDLNERADALVQEAIAEIRDTGIPDFVRSAREGRMADEGQKPQKPLWVKARIIAAPKIRQIYWCDFWQDAHLPEMWKTRPVIVVSYKNTLYGPCLVVPTTTEPDNENNRWACKLSIKVEGRFDSWAICNQPSTVAASRFSQFRGRIPLLPEKDFNQVLELLQEWLSKPFDLEK